MYLSTSVYINGELQPKIGENYQTFVARAVPALVELNLARDETIATQMCDSAWDDYVLDNAVEATIKLKREYYNDDTMYISDWYGCWQVESIIAATMPTMTYSAVEKSRSKSSGNEKFRVAKSVEEKQMVFGWANIAKDANGDYPIDWDGDVTSPSDLENAAYQYVLKYRTTGEKHEGEAVGQLIESVMFTKEKQEVMGIPDGTLPEGWWVGFYVPDKEVFAKIKSGEYEMLSVQGSAKRVPTGQ